MTRDQHLTKEFWMRDAQSVAARVFRSGAIWGPKFTETLPLRSLGYPFYQHDLTRDQWSNFLLALRASGHNEQDAYATVFVTTPGFWKITLDSPYPYPGLIAEGWPSIYESAIYSTLGEWAITVVDEEFALAAGSQRFIDSLQKHMPEFNEAAVDSFIRDQAENLPWMNEVLTHVGR